MIKRNPTAFAEQAKRLIVERQFQEAVRVCRLGLLATPTNIEGRLVLAGALLALGRHDEVLAEMRIALERHEGLAEAHLLRGEALFFKGDLDRAEASLRRAASLNSSTPIVKRVETRLEELARARAKGGRRPASAARFGVDRPDTKEYPRAPHGRAAAHTAPPEPSGEIENSGEIDEDPETTTGFAFGTPGGSAAGPDFGPELVTALGPGPAAGSVRDPTGSFGPGTSTVPEAEISTQVGEELFSKVTESLTDPPLHAVDEAARRGKARAALRGGNLGEVISLAAASAAGWPQQDGDRLLPVPTEMTEPPSDPGPVSPARRTARLGAREEVNALWLDPMTTAASSPPQGAAGRGDELVSNPDLDNLTTGDAGPRPLAAPAPAADSLDRSRDGSRDDSRDEPPRLIRLPGDARTEPLELEDLESLRVKEDDDDDELSDDPSRGAPTQENTPLPPTVGVPRQAPRRRTEALPAAEGRAALEVQPAGEARLDPAGGGFRVVPETIETLTGMVTNPVRPAVPSSPSYPTGTRETEAAVGGRSARKADAGNGRRPTSAVQGQRKSRARPAAAVAHPFVPGDLLPRPASVELTPTLTDLPERGDQGVPSPEELDRKRAQLGIPPRWLRSLGRLRLPALALVGVVVLLVAAVLMWVELQKRRRITALRRDAETQLAVGNLPDYKAADRLYQSIIGERSTQHDAWGGRARVAASLAVEFGVQEAVEGRATDFLVQQGQESVEAALARAYLLLARGDLDGAERLAERGAQQHGLPWFHYLIGRARLMRGDPQGALPALAEAVKRGPGLVLPERTKGEAYAQLGRFVEARQAVVRALTLAPAHVRSLIDRARLDVRQGEPLGTAEQTLRYVIGRLHQVAAPSELAWAELGLSEIQRRQGQLTDSRSWLKKALAHRPVADAEFSELYVEELLATGDLVQAEREARAVLGRYPARLGPRWQLAELSIRRGRYSEALRELDGPAGRTGQESGLIAAPRPWLLRGWAMMGLGHHDQARAALQQARQLAPEHPQVRLQEARLALVTGDRTRARTLLGPLASRFVHDGQVVLLQAQLALAEGQLEVARTGFERALALDASDPQTWTTLGRLRHQLGRLTEALTAFEVALRLSPAQPEAVLGLARVVHDQGDLGRAQREAERALTLSRADPRQALVLLAWIRHENREPLVVASLVKRAQAVTGPALEPLATRRQAVELARLEAGSALMRDEAGAALTVLERANQSHPREPELEALLLEARLRRARGRQRRSLLSDLSKPGTTPLRLLAARLALADGRAAEAVTLVQLVLESRLKERASPRLLATTHALLAHALIAASQTEAAATVLRSALGQSPRTALVHLMQSLVHEARGRTDLADASLTQAALLQPRLPDVQFYLAQRHLRQRNPAAAKLALRAYLELDPAGALVAAAREQLKRL